MPFLRFKKTGTRTNVEAKQCPAAKTTKPVEITCGRCFLKTSLTNTVRLFQHSSLIIIILHDWLAAQPRASDIK